LFHNISHETANGKWVAKNVNNTAFIEGSSYGESTMTSQTRLLMLVTATTQLPMILESGLQDPQLQVMVKYT
jgi:hypothetical protein